MRAGVILCVLAVALASPPNHDSNQQSLGVMSQILLVAVGVAMIIIVLWFFGYVCVCVHMCVCVWVCVWGGGCVCGWLCVYVCVGGWVVVYGCVCGWLCVYLSFKNQPLHRQKVARSSSTSSGIYIRCNFLLLNRA